MKLRTASLAILLVSITILCNPRTGQINYHWGNPPTNIDSIPWQPIMVSSNDTLTVKWANECGTYQERRCFGIWENREKDLLTGKDGTKVEIIKVNCSDFFFSKDSL